MTKWITVLIAAITITSCTKDHTFNRIPTLDNGVYRDQVYGSNVNWLGQNESLAMDVYLPDAAVNDSSGKKFPFLLYVHGGGFHTGDKSTAENFARLMNLKGYVVASINYRLGWTQDENNACIGDSTQAKEAVYRALQDTRAAMRYAVANADKFAIDTNYVYVGGSSAGGVTSLNVTYVTPDNAAQVFPGVVEKLGPLDATNSLTNHYTIKGVVSMWGAMSDLNLITRATAKPTIFFHGELDEVVPYDVSHFYTCDNYPVSYGTKPIYDRLNSLGVPAVANIDPQGGHGVYTVEFRADNIACFLNSLTTKQPQTGYFVGDMGNCK